MLQLWIVLCLIPIVALSEAANPNVLNTFDPNFFGGAKPQATPAPGQGNGVSSSGRSLGDEPDYNSAQRSEWLKKCAPLKDKNPDGYKKCYFDEKGRAQQQLKESQEAVERKQSDSRSIETPTDQLWEKRTPSEDDFKDKEKVED